LVFERSHESFDYVANIEHAYGRTADSVYGRVKHSIHDGISNAGKSGIQDVAGILYEYLESKFRAFLNKIKNKCIIL
jgi:hypothetical protein